jgi:hypothetical protein
MVQRGLLLPKMALPILGSKESLSFLTTALTIGAINLAQ